MTILPRGLARSFRAVAHSCVSGRPRGPAPPVVVRASDGRLSLATAFAGVAVAVTAPAPPDPGDETIIVPADAFARADTAGEVQVVVDERGGRLRWAGRAGPGEVPFDPQAVGSVAPMPAVPGDLTHVPPAFLSALDECGRTTAGESTRFALSRVQVRGRVGQVVGTDGVVALIRGGFDLPFADDPLVPAVRACGGHRRVAERPPRR